MATGGEIVELITRKQIGERMQNHRTQATDKEIPIDCFFLQMNYPFRKWIRTLEVQQEVEAKITDITDKFLIKGELQGYGKWFKVDPDDDCPLTYFLDAQEGKNREKFPQLKNEPWYEFEETLNKGVRQELRKELKEKDPSFRDMPVKLMRACMYFKVKDDIN